VSYGGGYGGGGLRIGPAQTPAVIRDLIVVTGAALLLQWILGFALPGGAGEPGAPPLPLVVEYGGLRPSLFFRGMVWQPLTTLFLHAEFMHFAGNMFFLWMFGSSVADALGRQRFLALYLGGGVAGGCLQLFLSLVLHLVGIESTLLPWELPTIGASGAVFTVVAVYCFSWPDRTISLLFLPLSFTARWLLPIEFLMEFGFAWQAVSHAAHLCGVLVGWWWWKSGDLDRRILQWMGRLRHAWSQRQAKHLKVVDRDRKDQDGPVFH